MNFLIAAGEPVVDKEVGVSISPSELTVSTSNGSYTSPTLRVNVVNTTGEVSYFWGADIPIVESTNDTAKIKVSGYNVIISAVVFCDVTDDNGTYRASINADITFGKGGYIQ